MHAPFHASMLRPASQAGPMHEFAGAGKLVIAALLSLVYEVWCANLFLTELVGPALCRRDRVTQEAGHVGLMGRDRGEILSDVVHVYLYCPAFNVSVSLMSNPGMHAGRLPCHLAPCTVSPAHQHAALYLLLSLTKQWVITECHLDQYLPTVTDYRGRCQTLFACPRN